MSRSVLCDLEDFINSGTKPQYILNNGYITKGAIDSYNQYKFVVNSNDHLPAHFHISINNNQIAKYSIENGLPLSSSNHRLDELVLNWISRDNHLELLKSEWQKFHGDKV